MVLVHRCQGVARLLDGVARLAKPSFAPVQPAPRSKLIVFRDIRCIKYRLPRSSVRATRAGSPVTEIRVSSRAQTFRAAVSPPTCRAAAQHGVVDALHGWSETKWSTALTVTWCWPYGKAPRAEVNLARQALILRWTAARWFRRILYESMRTRMFPPCSPSRSSHCTQLPRLSRHEKSVAIAAGKSLSSWLLRIRHSVRYNFLRS